MKQSGCQKRGGHGLLLTIFMAFFMAGCHHPAAGPRPELLQRPLYTFSEADIDEYLGPLRNVHPEVTERIIALGRQNIGQPYEIFLLGEFPFEEYDPDPIYCLSKSDCLTFCEHMYSMALASDWWGFMRNLQRIRYRDGIIGMVTRNHYTLAEWNRNNGFLFEDMTPKLGGGQVVVQLQQVCRRARFFEQFGIGQDIPDEPITDVYVPKERLPEVLHELRNGDFVNIIRGNEKSQWCGHTGLVAIGDDGTVNLLHSARPTVREQPLVEYVNTNRRCLGVKILRLRHDAERIMRESLADSPDATAISKAAMNAALEQRWEDAPDAAKPIELDWRDASHLQSYRLGYDSPVDAELQAALEQIDVELGKRFNIPTKQRAVGVLDLTELRLALIRPDEMFYAASVPKICILAAYFEMHPTAATELTPEVELELGKMIKRSDNALAAKYGQLVTLEKLREFVESKRYRFYDKNHGGGLWIGKHYSKDSPRFGDPLHDHSHGATVRQCLRYYLMLEQGRLVNVPACTKMREIFASAQVQHIKSKFVKGMEGRDVDISRKSGTWKDWHLDTARVTHGERVYLIAALTHHPRGAEYLSAIVAAVDDWLCDDR